MKYLQKALQLRELINQANEINLDINKTLLTEKNLIFLQQSNDELLSLPMESFTNEFVNETLVNNTATECIVISDIAKMDVQGQDLHYFLYKAYHKDLEKGLVYFQPINSETFEAKGELQFSNAEDNIFFTVDSPDLEESSCNAMETGDQTETEKNIVFLIGHSNQERLLYDIERLIYDTVNNVQKNNTVLFKFIVQVSLYGESISSVLKSKIESIEIFAQKELKSVYSNASFTFDYE